METQEVLPVLRADGVSNDREAMQALIDGKRVRMPDGSVQQRGADGVVRLPLGGTCKIEGLLDLAGSTLG